MAGIIQNDTLEQLIPLLKNVDQGLVSLERDRRNTPLLEALILNFHTMSELSQPLSMTSELSLSISEMLKKVLENQDTISSAGFEILFNVMPLLQEQLEWCQAHDSEVRNSQWEPLSQALQRITSPQPEAIPAAVHHVTAETPATASPEMMSVLLAHNNKILEMIREVEEVTYAGDLDAIREHVNECIHFCESLALAEISTIESSHGESITSILEELKVMVRQWGIVQGKDIELVVGEHYHVTNKKQLSVLRKALFQCSEYLIESSLETPSNRRKKEPKGHIYIDITEENDNLLIGITDDGRGLRTDFLKNRALERGVTSNTELKQMEEYEIWYFLFREAMFSREDAEVGANLPKLKIQIEELGGTIGLESVPGEMSSFLLVLPQKTNLMGEMSGFNTKGLPEDVSRNLENLQDSVDDLQFIIHGGAMNSDGVTSLEKHLSSVFSTIKHLVEKINQGGSSKGLDLKEIAMVDLFGEVGNITREMHDKLKDFGTMMDSQFQNLTMERIPDAAHRLEHIIEMTETSANTTLDLAEKLTLDSNETSEDMDALKKLLGQKTVDVEACLKIVESVKAREVKVNDSLLDVMTAQDYQDRTGQVIRKIIELVNDMEQRLVSLITKFGTILGVNPDESASSRHETATNKQVNISNMIEEITPENVEMYGPQHSKGKGMTDQDDVDSLLAQFGF
ncbi:MAG: protein phosphatase CheZ [SAR324 cluster bacterium]|nr:protein phosphatase CheZ [SAR324 cluster bacterium]